MTSSKVFLLLGLVAAIVLLISSEVAARDLAETSTESVHPDGFTLPPSWKHLIPKPSPKVQPRVFGNGCANGRKCCGIQYKGRCTKCCASASETAQKAVEVKPEN